MLEIAILLGVVLSCSSACAQEAPKVFAIRLAQVDVIYSRLAVAGETMSGNDLRYGAGIVIKFGK